MPSAGDVARFLSAAQSDVGRTRSENQDAFGEFSTASGERLFVVADGMGGHRGGATASRICVEAIGRAFGEGRDSAEERLRRGIELANERIHGAADGESELSGMGTTVVALALAPDGTGALGWVGDSRAYRFSDGMLERLSTDHSVVGEMIRSGVITAEEAEAHPRRNELLRAIGPHHSVEVETLELRHKPGDRFLLCSDGLWGPVPEAEVAAVLGYEAPELAVKKLVAKANERGGPDNVTVQIASVEGAAARRRPAVASGAARVARRSTSKLLLLMASGAVAASATLIAVAVYTLQQAAPGAAGPTLVAPPEGAPDAEVAASAPESVAVAPSAPQPAAKPASAQPAAAKPAAAKPAPAQPAPAKPAAAKPAPAHGAVAEPRPAPAPSVAQNPAPVQSAAAPAVAEPVVAPEQGEVAGEPAETAAIASQPPPSTSGVPTASREQVERFFADWERAVSGQDFALYAKLGLPGDEQAFRTHYVDNSARVEFALHSVELENPDAIVVRVRMLLETSDQTGPRRVDEERTFIVAQTPSGLRYVGIPQR